MWTGLQVREQTDGRYAIVATVYCGYFRFLPQHCWSAGRCSKLLHYLITITLLKSWGRWHEPGAVGKKEGKEIDGKGVWRQQEREWKKEKERSLRTVLSLFKCFSESIKMYWALRQQPKSSSKLYVEKIGIIPQVSTMIYNNMNESWLWQSSIYLMKNLLKRKK